MIMILRAKLTLARRKSLKEVLKLISVIALNTIDR